MKNSSYYITPVGDWTHDLPHTVDSNMVKVSHALNHSATEAVCHEPVDFLQNILQINGFIVHVRQTSMQHNKNE